MDRIVLKSMSNKMIVRLMMENTEYDQFQKIAKALDMEKSTFQSKLDRDNLRVKELKEIADLLGYDIVLEEKK